MGNGKFTQTAPIGGGTGSGGGGGTAGPWVIAEIQYIVSATANDGAPVPMATVYSAANDYLVCVDAGGPGGGGPFTLNNVGYVTPYADPAGLFGAIGSIQINDLPVGDIDFGNVWYLVQSGSPIGGSASPATNPLVGQPNGVLSSTINLEFTTGVFTRQFLDNGVSDVYLMILSRPA
jgi:hypothetical protein